jgi:hypothetical protein
VSLILDNRASANVKALPDVVNPGAATRENVEGTRENSQEAG